MSDARKLLCQARFLDCVYLSVLPPTFDTLQAESVVGENMLTRLRAMANRGMVKCIKVGKRGSPSVWMTTDRGRDMAKAAVELWCELG